MLGQEENTRDLILNQYKGDVERLVKYLPWLHKVTGQEVKSYYEGNGEQKVMQIPVYDSTLLAFVKEAQKTQLITKNYPYTYTRFQIQSVSDELRLIKETKIYDFDLFRAILSKYVLEGQRKAETWSIAVREGIFTELLDRLNDLFFRYAP